MDEKYQKLKTHNPWGGNTLSRGYVRTLYTDKIIRGEDRPVKVVTGQRRAGKSYVLRQTASKLIEGGVGDENIFFVDRRLPDFDFLKNQKDLDELIRYYKLIIKPSGRIYFFIDEIQDIAGWENLITSYLNGGAGECAFFISGSNPNRLLERLSFLLPGRCSGIDVYPFCFAEYADITQQEPSAATFAGYMDSGGIPDLFMLDGDRIRRNYMSSFMDSILLRDMIQDRGIKDAVLMDYLFAYLISNVSLTLSVSEIPNLFRGRGRNTSLVTISAYLRHIEDARLAHRVEHYNIEGTDTVASGCKYYINDPSFGNYLHMTSKSEPDHRFENIVYLELARRGFDVYTCSIKDAEIDFAAFKGSRMIYIQCAGMSGDKKTVEGKCSVLEGIEDNFEKIIVSSGEVKTPQGSGVRHVRVWDLDEAL
ncbi:MAG: ATP-binding protein [Tannerellaceae bacterium]|jgi:predicted AAA+ superfamily ATPase|nr:ATP-binding protein [Tannerellaceae bacterium]